MRIIVLILLLIAWPVSVLANNNAEEAAKIVAEMQNSIKMQNAINEQMARMKKEKLIEQIKKVTEESQAASRSLSKPVAEPALETASVQVSEPAENVEMSKPLILIFISSSMPTEILTRLTAEGAKLTEEDAADVVFLLRGIPAEGLKMFGHRLNPENYGISLRIDPFLYQKLEIDKVPIVVVDRVYAILHPASLKSAINEIKEAGYGELAQILAY